MPKKKKIYTVQRNSFVNKDAREQFERITYSRLVDVTLMGQKTMEYMQNLIIPVGVLVDIKVY
jgi:small subunit ribosomal protein S10